MSCQRFREAIVDHACGAAIDPGAAAHLGSCEDCRRLHARVAHDLDDVDRLLRGTMTVGASPAFVARVTAPAHAARAAHWPRWWIGAAAALAFAAYLVIPTPQPARTDTAGVAAVEPSTVLPHRTPQAAVSVQRKAAAGASSQLDPQPRVARDPVRKRPRQPRAPAAGSTAAPEPIVLVDARQAQALARLRELTSRGVLDEDTLPPARAVTDLEIAPLTVPDIIIPDVLAASGTGATDQQ